MLTGFDFGWRHGATPSALEDPGAGVGIFRKHPSSRWNRSFGRHG